MPGALIVRADYAKEHPEHVAKFLAVYLRGWAGSRPIPRKRVAMMKNFYEQGGVEISDQRSRDRSSHAPDLRARRSRSKIMDARRGASEVDAWFGKIGELHAGTAPSRSAPDAKTFIDDAYLKRVAGSEASGLRDRVRRWPAHRAERVCPSARRAPFRSNG